MNDTPFVMDPRLIVAEVAKLEAEAKKTLLEAEGLELEHALKRETIRKEQAEADKAQAQAASTRAHTDATLRAETLELVRNHYHFEYNFLGGVSEDTVDPCLAQLTAWDRMYPGERNPDGSIKTFGCPMKITINSPGGSAIDGMHLFDDIVGYSLRGGGTHHVTIKVRGYAASMGGILLQAADRRVIGPEAYLMIHEIAAGTGGKIGDMKDDMVWYQRMCDRIANVFVTRAAEVDAKDKIDLATFKAKWERHDWWLDSQQSLDLGFVDAIG